MKVKIYPLLLLMSIFVFIQCDDKDEYYERPSWLEDPIYQVLDSKGRFSEYLKCVDRTLYDRVLKGAGFYTVFAPNNDAMASFLREKGYASVEAIPQQEVENLVAYSIIYTRWESAILGKWLNSSELVDGAFRRQTSLYTLPYRDPEYDNKWVYNQTQRTSSYYIESRNNYKFLPVFTSDYFTLNQLSVSDYNTFFPETDFTGLNVFGGAVLEKDVYAENGIIHEVSAVSEPLKNADEILQESEYSLFRSFFDYRDGTGGYAFKSYIPLTGTDLERFQKIMPDSSITELYVKYYINGSEYLSFSPLLETVYSETEEAYNSQIYGNTVIIPSNEALKSYLDEKVWKYYQNDLQSLPFEVVSQLINTHLINDMVWPSKFANMQNVEGEYLNGKGSSGPSLEQMGLIEPRFSNTGMVYYLDNVVKSSYFETVYSEIFINPVYSFLNLAYKNFQNLKTELLKSELNGYNTERNTLLLYSNELFREDGYRYDDVNSVFVNDAIQSGNASDRISRLMRMHLFTSYETGSITEMNDFSGGNVGCDDWGFTVSYYGNPVRYRNNQLQAAGNIEDGTYVNIERLDNSPNNGTVYVVDNLLQYSPRNTYPDVEEGWKDVPLWTYLDRARTENPSVSDFVDYVEKLIKVTGADELTDITEDNFYTVLMVNNDYMQDARLRGIIPELALAELNTETGDRALKFLLSHFLRGRTLMDDGLPYLYPVNLNQPNRAIMPTMLTITNDNLGLAGERMSVVVEKNTGNSNMYQFTPQDVTLGSTVLVKGDGIISALPLNRMPISNSASAQDEYRTNRIAGKSVLHEFNGYFNFVVQD